MATPVVSNVGKTGYQQIQTPKLSPEQQGLFSQAISGIQPGFSQGLGHLSGLAGGRPEAFQSLEAPAMRDLQTALGQIGSRFSGMGTGARRSSGFNLATSGAAQEFAENLSAKRLSLQQDAIRQLMGLYGELMGRDTFETSFIPKQKPFWQELAIGLSHGVGEGIGKLPMLAM